jgi:hypothetical protein
LSFVLGGREQVHEGARAKTKKTLDEKADDDNGDNDDVDIEMGVIRSDGYQAVPDQDVKMAAASALENLSEEERLSMMKQFKITKFKKGQTITKEGAYGDRFYVISEGTVDLTKGGSFLGELTAGAFFGELALLSSDSRRTATVSAKSDVTLYYVTRKVFNQVLNGDFGDAIIKASGNRMGGKRNVGILRRKMRMTTDEKGRVESNRGISEEYRHW